MQRKRHTTEFKIEALELAKQTGSFAEAARQLGITDGLVRLSVGVEALEDLIADVAGALE